MEIGTQHRIDFDEVMPRYTVGDIVDQVRAAEVVCGSTRVITIDGPAGSGKTTLSASLAAALVDCQIIHMDDLYDGWSQDLDRELAERIETSILAPLRRGSAPQYRKYDWHVQAFTDLVTVPRSQYVILDGVGSGNPLLRECVTLAIWIESDSESLVDRVLDRDGEQLRADLLRWQQHESQYFAAHDVKKAADLHLRGDG
jgi:uridine kinase